MRIYGLSGLGADHRIFAELKLTDPVTVIRFTIPDDAFSLAEYSKTLLPQIDQTEPVILIGVSFGGMIATELQKHIEVLRVILISSAQNSLELPRLYRSVGRCCLLKRISPKYFQLPKIFAYWLFGAKNKKLLAEILDDTDTGFVRWAILAIIRWEEKGVYPDVISIHGTKDRILPVNNKQLPVISLPNGGHFMVVDMADQVSSILNAQISDIIAGEDNH